VLVRHEVLEHVLGHSALALNLALVHPLSEGAKEPLGQLDFGELHAAGAAVGRRADLGLLHVLLPHTLADL